MLVCVHIFVLLCALLHLNVCAFVCVCTVGSGPPDTHPCPSTLSQWPLGIFRDITSFFHQTVNTCILFSGGVTPRNTPEVRVHFMGTGRWKLLYPTLPVSLPFTLLSGSHPLPPPFSSSPFRLAPIPFSLPLYFPWVTVLYCDGKREALPLLQGWRK